MRHFQKLIIENFQSHEFTEIDFVPGLNVFVGPSDSGKSSILRALRWVLFNQPRGADFIRTGATKCQVCLILDDGTEILRIRGKSINRYLLRTPDGSEEVYESLGSGAHPMILQAHQMYPLTWDQKELVIQFGTQLEGPFLLSESGGAKAKLIGRISGAHWIDLALKEATRERNQLNSEMKQLEKQKAALTEKLTPYEQVPQLEDSMYQAQEIYQTAKRKKHKLERLMHLSKQLHEVQGERQKQAKLLAQFDILAELEQRHWENERLRYQLRELKNLAQKWEYTQSETNKYHDLLQQTKFLPEIERSFLHMGEKKGRLISLQHMSARWQDHQLVKLDNQKHIDQLQSLPEAIWRYEKLLSRREQIQNLKRVQNDWVPLQQAKKVHVGVMQTTEQTINWINEKQTAFDQTLKNYHQLLRLFIDYQDVKTRLVAGERYLQSQTHAMVNYSEEYKQLLAESGKCPTCGSLIDSLLLEHLEQELYGGVMHAAVGRADEND